MSPHCKNVDEKFVFSLEWFSIAVMVFSTGLRLSWVLVDGIVPTEIFFSEFGHFFCWNISNNYLSLKFFSLFCLNSVFFEIHLPKLYILVYLYLIGDRWTAGKPKWKISPCQINKVKASCFCESSSLLEKRSNFDLFCYLLFFILKICSDITRKLYKKYFLKKIFYRGLGQL
jgi:hypothetical protein